MLAFISLVVGIVMLIGGGGLLVRGASEIATKLGVSPLVVGLAVLTVDVMSLAIRDACTMRHQLYQA